MRFDTRDKKPKLYFLIPITVAALIVFMIAHNSPEKNSVFLCILVIAYLSAAVSSLIWAFFAQLRYNPYSYNTIYYVGFALFIFFGAGDALLFFIHTVPLSRCVFRK